jgi:hypothetical protein
MGIIMSGDFNPDEMIARSTKLFLYEKQTGSGINPGQESPIMAPITGKFRPNPENVMMDSVFRVLRQRMQEC